MEKIIGCTNININLLLSNKLIIKYFRHKYYLI